MKRPFLKIELDLIDRIVQVVGIIALIALVGLPIYYFDQLPDEIPSHYGANGKADDYRGKGIIWTLPILGLVMYAGLHWLNKYPHIFNYPLKVTEDNVYRLYKMATRITRFINAQIAIAFAYIVYSTIHTALNNQDGLSPYFLVIFLLSNFALVFFLFFKTSKK